VASLTLVGADAVLGFIRSVAPELPEQARGLGLGLSLTRMSLGEDALDPGPLLGPLSTVVPEPGTALLLAAGLAGLGIAGRRH